MTSIKNTSFPSRMFGSMPNDDCDEDMVGGGGVGDEEYDAEAIIDPNFMFDEEESDEQICDQDYGQNGLDLRYFFETAQNIFSRDYLEWHTSTVTKAIPGHIFRRNPNVIPPTKCVSTVLEAYHLFITENMFNTVVNCTNNFISEIRKKFTRSQDCKATTKAEIKAFLGILYLLAALRMHHTSIKQIWANDSTGVEIFRLIMSSNRFSFLMRCLRFDNKATRDKNDRLAPIRQIYDEFNANLQNNYTSGPFIAIGQKYFGNAALGMNIPARAGSAKYGIKIFAAVDCLSYYTSKIEIQCASDPEYNSPINVVKRLTSHLLGEGRTITMGNWFTSYEVLKYLLQNKTTMTGTLRRTSNEVPNLMVQSVGREINSSLFLYREDCSLSSKFVKNNKCILYLSSLHKDNRMAANVKCGLTEVNNFYNQTKNGIDTVDRLAVNYTVARNCRNRHSLSIFFSFLNIAAINSLAVLQANKQTIDFKQPHFKTRFSFLKKLAFDLFQPFLEERCQVKSLQKPLKRKIENLVKRNKGEEVVEENDGDEVEAPVPPKQVKFVKPLRCLYCGPNIRSIIGCSTCSKPICNKHKYSLCPDCVDEYRVRKNRSHFDDDDDDDTD